MATVEKIMISLPRPLVEQLKDECERTGSTRSGLIRTAVEQLLQNRRLLEGAEGKNPFSRARGVLDLGGKRTDEVMKELRGSRKDLVK